MLALKRTLFLVSCLFFSSVFPGATPAWRKHTGKAVAAAGGLGLVATIIKLIALEKQAAGAKSLAERNVIKSRISKWRMWLGATLAAAGVGAGVAFWPSNDGVKSDAQEAEPLNVQLQNSGNGQEVLPHIDMQGPAGTVQPVYTQQAGGAGVQLQNGGSVHQATPIGESAQEPDGASSGQDTAIEDEVVGTEPVSVSYEQVFAPTNLQINEVISCGSYTVYGSGLISQKGSHGHRLDKKYQDSFSVGVDSTGCLRVCVADGTNFNDLDSQISSLGTDGYVVLRYANSGGWWAKVLAQRVQKIQDFSANGLHSMNDALFQEFAVEEKRQKLMEFYNLVGRNKISAANAFAQRIPSAWHTDLAINGGATVAAVSFNEKTRRIKMINVGDGGAIILCADGSMIHGPSQHPSLEGTGCKAGKNSLGYDGDVPIAEEFEFNLPDDALYVIVACDGFWDMFNGPQRIIADSAEEYTEQLKKGWFPSLNLGQKFTAADIEQSIIEAQTAQGRASSESLIRKDYDARVCKERSSTLSVDIILKVLREAKGQNLSQLLVEKARTCAAANDADDDITVVVVDLRSVPGSTPSAPEIAIEALAGDKQEAITRIIDGLPDVSTEAGTLECLDGSNKTSVSALGGQVLKAENMQVWAGYMTSAREDVLSVLPLSNGALRIIDCDGAGGPVDEATRECFKEEAGCIDRHGLCPHYPHCPVEVARYVCDTAKRGEDLMEAQRALTRDSSVQPPSEAYFKYAGGQAVVTVLDIKYEGGKFEYAAQNIGDNGAAIIKYSDGDVTLQPLVRSTHRSLGGNKTPGSAIVSEKFGLDSAKGLDGSCVVNKEGGSIDGDFIIVASDGLWDVLDSDGRTGYLSYEQLYHIIFSACNANKNPAQALAELARQEQLKHTHSRGEKDRSRQTKPDDISVIVVDLRAARVGDGSTVAGAGVAAGAGTGAGSL